MGIFFSKLTKHHIVIELHDVFNSLEHLPIERWQDVCLEVVHGPPRLGLVEGERLNGLGRDGEVELSQDALPGAV